MLHIRPEPIAMHVELTLENKNYNSFMKNAKITVDSTYHCTQNGQIVRHYRTSSNRV